MAQGFGWYLDQIGRVPLLTPAEEIELGTAVRRWLDWPDGPDQAPPGVARRGRRAKDRFVSANLRLSVNFVRNRCHRLMGSGEIDDVIQEANNGLIRAVEKFDPRRGYRFSTYAMWWVMQAVNRYFDTSASLIRLPGLHNQLVAKVRRAAAEFERTHGRQPDGAELSAAAEIPEARIQQLLAEHRRTISMDVGIGDDGTDTLADVLAAPAPPEVDDSPELQQLRADLAALPEQAHQVLALRFGFHGAPCRSTESGPALGMEPREVLKVERQALEQLRQAQQHPRPDHPQPERFAHRLGPQLCLLQLPRHGAMISTRRRNTRRRLAQRDFNLKRADATQCLVYQHLLPVVIKDDHVGVGAKILKVV